LTEEHYERMNKKFLGPGYKKFLGMGYEKFLRITVDIFTGFRGFPGKIPRNS